jgi:hypothetical protein
LDRDDLHRSPKDEQPRKPALAPAFPFWRHLPDRGRPSHPISGASPIIRSISCSTKATIGKGTYVITKELRRRAKFIHSEMQGIIGNKGIDHAK